jgi:Uma2 family endonuclease
MKAIIPNVSESVLATRRSWGADRADEVWNGVLHMLPPPRKTHQQFEGELETWIRNHWVTRGKGQVYHQIAISPLQEHWTQDYRVPDLVLLTPDRFHIDRETYFCGAPTMAVELKSEDDETYEKLDFYADLQIPELWVIDADTCQPELHALAGSSFTPRKADHDGWLQSVATGIQFRAVAKGLEIQLTVDPNTLTTLGEK